MRTHHRHKVHKPKVEEPKHKHKHKHKHESHHIKFLLPPIKWRPHHPRATAAGLLALFTAVCVTAGVTSGSWMSRPATAANQERYYPTVSYGAARSCVLDHWAPKVQVRVTQQKWCSPVFPCDKVKDNRGGTLVPLKESCIANHATNGICWQYSVFSTCSGTWSDKLRYDHCLAIRSLCSTRVLTVFSSFTSFFSVVAGICSLLVTWERVGWLQFMCQSHRGELRTAHRWRLYRLRVLTRLVVLMRVCFGASFLCMTIVCIKFGVWTTKLQKVFAHKTPSRPGGCAAMGDCPVLGPGFYYTVIAMGAAATGGVASMLQPAHKLGANKAWEESFPAEPVDGPPAGALALTPEGEAAAREAEEREHAEARQALEAADAAEAAEGAAEAAEEEAEKKRDEEEAEREQREKREHQQHQVSRLHTILKPFMLRRVKTDVMHEMPDKVEIQLKCQLTSRQRALYKRLRKKLSLADLLTSKTLNKKQSDKNMEHLMNMVMQFRKVCNHPEIFEVRRKEESGGVGAVCTLYGMCFGSTLN